MVATSYLHTMDIELQTRHTMNHISLKEGRHRFDAKSPTALEEHISDNTRPHWLHWMGDALLSHAQSAVRWLAFNHVVLQVLIKLMS